MNILVVDDNQSSAEAMSRILRKQGHSVETLFDGASAIQHLRTSPPTLVFTDLKMEPVGGMEVLRAARSCSPPVEVVVFTAFGAVDKAVEAMQMGARDFLTKPISVEQILDRVASLSGEPDTIQPAAPEMVAHSPVAQSMRRTLEALADVPSPVWIEGEVGSGRGTAARQLHELAGGVGPLTVLDPSIPTAWPTSGLVVLNDVDELSDDAQQALARRLKNLPSDVRVIATSRPGAQSRVADGTLRTDLYFTLAVVVLELPPLRERQEDIRPLFQQALQAACTKFKRPMPELQPAELALLEEHDWPGNLKELLNLAERTAVLGRNGYSLRPQPRPAASGEVSADVFVDGFKLAEHLESIESRLLALALEHTNGDRTAAGRLLGVERNTLRYKLKKYGLLP